MVYERLNILQTTYSPFYPLFHQSPPLESSMNSKSATRFMAQSVRALSLGAVALTALFLGGDPSLGRSPNASAEEVPTGLKPIKHPQDNLPSEAKIALGMQLFFDGRLSSDNKISCASCHDPSKGWSNGEAFATGVEGQQGGRSAQR